MPRTQQNDSTNAAASSSGSAGIASGGASATAASSSSPVSSGNYICPWIFDPIEVLATVFLPQFAILYLQDHLLLLLLPLHQHLDKFQVETEMVAMATEALRPVVPVQIPHQLLVLTMQVLVKPWRRVQQYKPHRRWVS